MSSGFVTEAEIEERKRIRQEEWEKVRKPNEPLEAPEEEYDRRTLYERLEEQRQKKELEYEETHKLKNMIKGLDDDEIEFLDMVDRTKMEQEKRVQVEEAKEVLQFRSKVAALREQKCLAENLNDDETLPFSHLNEPFSTNITPRNKVLASIITKKRSSSKQFLRFSSKKVATEGVNAVKSVSPTSDENINVAKSNSSDETVSSSSNKYVKDDSRLSRHGVMKETMVYPSAMHCIGILPGIGSYMSDDTSDSENTSGSDIEDNYNIRGQKVQENVKSP